MRNFWYLETLRSLWKTCAFKGEKFILGLIPYLPNHNKPNAHIFNRVFVQQMWKNSSFGNCRFHISSWGGKVSKQWQQDNSNNKNYKHRNKATPGQLSRGAVSRTRDKVSFYCGLIIHSKRAFAAWSKAQSKGKCSSGRWRGRCSGIFLQEAELGGGQVAQVLSESWKAVLLKWVLNGLALFQKA